ncbi:hypothetical protein M1843_00450 [Isoptericola sp. 4D.3]|uniref:Peptidase C39-like domain-containing protein n=1 Tax=Isoptericola peretonis TaxID=2918523 RepID=A0ABT0IYB1_9MICO|nr:hypothetical protein [Isoptericola sp. 4D.3]
MRAALRATDVLAAVGAFAGRPPASPPAGRFARPEVPDGLVPALAALAGPERAWVLDPLGRDAPPPRPGRPRPLTLAADGEAAPARQVDERTCGAAVLAMLLVAGDPRRGLELGRRPPGVAGSFAALQRTLHARTTRGPGGLPLWPAALGTPPWGAARVARYGRVRYTHRVVGRYGTRRSDGTRVLAAALAAAAAGVPVPLYTGGDLARGPAAAVPRHVVLLTAVRDGLAVLYEPSSARLHAVPAPALTGAGAASAVDRARTTAALGGWPHVVWALLPRDARG